MNPANQRSCGHRIDQGKAPKALNAAESGRERRRIVAFVSNPGQPTMSPASWVTAAGGIVARLERPVV
jgi:hypothetical protein